MLNTQVKFLLEQGDPVAHAAVIMADSSNDAQYKINKDVGDKFFKMARALKDKKLLAEKVGWKTGEMVC